MGTALKSNEMKVRKTEHRFKNAFEIQDELVKENEELKAANIKDKTNIQIYKEMMTKKLDEQLTKFEEVNGALLDKLKKLQAEVDKNSKMKIKTPVKVITPKKKTLESSTQTKMIQHMKEQSCQADFKIEGENTEDQEKVENADQECQTEEVQNSEPKEEKPEIETAENSCQTNQVKV